VLQKARTDSRHRYWKRKSESWKNKDPFHVSRKKELNNDDVTCIKRARKELGCNELQFFLYFCHRGVNINGTAVIISDYQLL
jgi:hypothetical protein